MAPLTMVLALLGAAVVMFALNRPRMDVVAVIMMVALPMTGVITVSEALAGLSDPNIVLIAALFVIGEALVRTGVAQRLGDWLTARAGASAAITIAAIRKPELTPASSILDQLISVRWRLISIMPPNNSGVSAGVNVQKRAAINVPVRLAASTIAHSRNSRQKFRHDESFKNGSTTVIVLSVKSC